MSAPKLNAGLIPESSEIERVSERANEPADTVSRNAGAGAENGSKQPHPTDPHRWADGTLRANNSNAVKHGAYAKRDVPAETRESVSDFAAGIVADLGGASELSTVQKGYIQTLRDLELTKRMFISHLASHGLFTPRGRTRSCYLSFLQTISAWDRCAQRLGSERKPKHIDPYEALCVAVDEANKP